MAAVNAEANVEPDSTAQPTVLPTETYNPYDLAHEVAQLLREKGLHPALEGNLVAAGGAAWDMLTAFGIRAAGDYRLIDRRNAPDDW